LIKRCTGSRLKTFSVTFDDPEFDERGFQQDAVRFLGTEHCEFRCSSEDIGRVFPDVVWHTETPLLRTAPAPFFLLARMVRQHGYKVVLTGEGSDETFGGYDLFKEAKIRRFWAAQPDSRWRPLLLKRLYPYLPQLQSQSPAYLQAFFRIRPEDCDSPFFSHLPRWNLTSGLKRFLSPDVKAELNGLDSLGDLRRTLPIGFRDWDGMSQAQYLETAGLLPGYILSSQGDRVAMSHAVEGRFPFLDHRVVEFAARLPARLKMRGLREKYLLKKSVSHLVPKTVQQRPKQPYRAPESVCFFGQPVRPTRHDYVEELLSERAIRDSAVFAPDAVRKLVHKARTGNVLSARDNMALVGILSTQLVVHRFIRHFDGQS
jgi:asparagine synthase (glutamine-hydrolysing)